MSKVWYGSITNRIEEKVNTKPEVGMGVTEYCWSDTHAYEIIAVKDERHITVRRLDHKRIDNNGMSDSQQYEYFSNEANHTCELFFTKQGVWRERIGRHLGCNTWGVGRAREYYDYSF